jgi:hypothetical protein
VYAIEKPTVHEWRHGEKLPSAKTMERIAEKTSANYDWLATGSGTIALMPSPSSLDMARRIDRAPGEVKGYISAILDAAEHRKDPPVA